MFSGPSVCLSVCLFVRYITAFKKFRTDFDEIFWRVGRDLRTK